MLILADTDGFGFDLHQLGERILQAAGNGNRATDGNVKLGKLARRKFRSRIHRGARFADHDLGEAQFGMAFNKVGGELVCFARGGAVADADQVNLVFLAKFTQHVQRLIPLIFGLVWINGGVVNQLAGIVNHRHFDAGTQSGIETERGTRARRCSQQ